jgi:hypothetical protein
MPRGRPRTRPVRTTPKRPYKRSFNFLKVKMAENKRLRAEACDARKAERALMALNKPQKRKYTRRKKTAANTMLTL